MVCMLLSDVMKRRSEGRKKSQPVAGVSNGGSSSDSPVSVTPGSSPSARTSKQLRRRTAGNVSSDSAENSPSRSDSLSGKVYTPDRSPADVKSENLDDTFEAISKTEAVSSPESGGGKKFGNKNLGKGNIWTGQSAPSTTRGRVVKTPRKDLEPKVESTSPAKTLPSSHTASASVKLETQQSLLQRMQSPITTTASAASTNSPITSWSSVVPSTTMMKREVVTSKLSTALQTGSYPPASVFGSSFSPSSYKNTSNSKKDLNQLSRTSPQLLGHTPSSANSQSQQQLLQDGSPSHFKPLPPSGVPQAAEVKKLPTTSLAYPQPAYPQSFKLAGYQVSVPAGAPISLSGAPISITGAPVSVTRIPISITGAPISHPSSSMSRLPSHTSYHLQTSAPTAVTTVSILSQQLSAGLRAKPLYIPHSSLTTSTVSGLPAVTVTGMSPQLATTSDRDAERLFEQNPSQVCLYFLSSKFQILRCSSFNFLVILGVKYVLACMLTCMFSSLIIYH